jgi:hypothetical protein
MSERFVVQATNGVSILQCWGPFEDFDAAFDFENHLAKRRTGVGLSIIQLASPIEILPLMDESKRRKELAACYPGD